MQPSCPSCDSSAFTPTGRFNTNRRNLRRAELRCDRCRYVWSSALPEALEAAERLAPPPEVHPGIPVSLPGMIEHQLAQGVRRQSVVASPPRRQPRRRPQPHQHDWKLAALGESS